MERFHCNLGVPHPSQDLVGLFRHDGSWMHGGVNEPANQGGGIALFQ
jgi:hypothetical protein